MTHTWEYIFPWVPVPELTQVSQSNELPAITDNIRIEKSEFILLGTCPIAAENKELFCYIDRTAFYQCKTSLSQGASIDMNLTGKGSILLSRSVVTECSSSTYNTLRFVLSSNNFGFINLTLCSFSKNVPIDNTKNPYNMGLLYGMRTIENINNSFCQSELFVGFVADSSSNTRVTRSNFASNIARQATMIFIYSGFITMSNIISNTEQATFSQYSGVITTNNEISEVTVDQCCIVDNTKLCRITDGKVIFYRCSISGGDTSVESNVVILASVSFEEHRNVHFASKGVGAVFPYKEEHCTEGAARKMLVPVCMTLAAAFVEGW